MSNFEIERKWLLCNPISEEKVRNMSGVLLKISQWYDVDGRRVRRTRVYLPNNFAPTEENWVLTTKINLRSGVRVENENIISEEYLISGEFKPVKVLEKNRYLVYDESFYWVVDFITNGDEGLVIIEREYDSIEEYELRTEIPDKFGTVEEVTDDFNYQSVNLAIPFDITSFKLGLL